jgi:hypothetical protein
MAKPIQDPETLVPTAISPLWPTMSLLAVAAILIGVLFSRLFPFQVRPGEAPVAKFTDITREAGLTFIHDNGARSAVDTPSTLAGAVAFLDYDNDGLPDLFFVGGTRWPWVRPEKGAAPTCALFHNDGNGHFTDVTREAGLDVNMLGMGVAVGDYLNEGRPDIFITGVGGNRLFHNLGKGKFADVTAAAGVRGDDHVWSTGAVWIDIYGDGRLDLVVCNYARWAPEADLRSAFAAEAAGRSYTTPAGFVSAQPTVYRNLGNGRFADVTARTGLNQFDRQTGFPLASPLAVAALDVNGDGRLDLLFTYQSGDDVLFVNQGDGTFRVWTPPAAERREGASAGLASASGLAFAQVERTNSRFGILRAAGLAFGPPSDEAESFCHLGGKLGVALLDYDLDGRMDVISGNGLAEPQLARFVHSPDLAAAPVLLWNNGNVWIQAPPPPGETALTAPLVARGIAVADIYGDGYPDVVIAQNGGPPRLLRNDQRFNHVRHAWLRIDLVGTHCQRDAGGARVEVHTPRRVFVQSMEPAMGFMAQSERTLTFGLGDDDRVGSVVVIWPGGFRQEVRSPGVNRRLVITETR